MRVAFTTLGCRLNQFETQAMAHRVREHAAPGEIVSWDQDAEIYVINSCTVTSRAEQKCRQLARAAKRRRPGARVVVVGCYSQLGADRLESMGEVDAILGNEEKRRLDHYLPRILAGEERVRAVGKLPNGLAMADEWIDDFGGLARPTLKLQEGCDMRCRFCAIWKARGSSRSRPPRDVVEQAKYLAESGFSEIVLGGVHLGHYGRELQPRTGLRALLEMLLENTPERLRIRLSSIDPSEVDAELVGLLNSEARLCRYLHLPLQSGSNEILRSMRRAYGVEYYEALVNSIVRRDPGFGLGVDLIVGYPGEEEHHFEEGLALLERLPLSFYHVFRYSDRPGTAASRLEGKVPGPVAQERSERLRELGRAKRQAFLLSQRGRRLEGIVESGVDEQGRVEIMLDNYATVWAAAPSVEERSLVSVEISEERDGRLLGSIVEDMRAAAL